MQQNIISQTIKNIRLKNNLTQQELANLLGVTFQAVSKWENGKSIPDIEILQLISEKFKVDFNKLVTGNQSKKHFKFIFTSVIIILLGIFLFKYNNNYTVKEIISTNNNFQVNGIFISNHNKSSIYISNIKYLVLENDKYQELEAILYESKDETHTQISKCKENLCEDYYLDSLLEHISFIVDSNTKIKDKQLYIQINALDFDNKMITFKIPLIVK